MNLWAAKWHSKNLLDGETRHLIIRRWQTGEFALFKTRRECREFIQEQYGYIKARPDLRAEPHGWRLPEAVKVEIVEVTI